MSFLCMGLRFNIWFEEEQLNKIKKTAKKKGLSVSSYLRNLAIEEAQKNPNQALGDYWTNRDELKEALEKLKKKK